MTEMSPIGSVGTLKYAVQDLKDEELYDLKSKQGFAPFSVEMKIVDDDNKELPWDGKTFGKLKVRGRRHHQGLFPSRERERARRGRLLRHRRRGDDRPQRLHADHRPRQGRHQVRRRMDFLHRLENVAVGHPDVAEAAVIGVPSSEMGRAAAADRRRQGRQVAGSRDDILKFLDGKIAKWWMPDDVQFVEEIPHTATGKINKTEAPRRLQGLQAADFCSASRSSDLRLLPRFRCSCSSMCSSNSRSIAPVATG
jgi:fatty-acyl-CoA synthase